MTTTAHTAKPAARATHPAAMLAVLLSAMFVAQFDFFVVNVAAPSLGRDLGAGPVALELIVGGYAFAYASGMITGGRLGDLYGHRRLFVAGMAAFTAASLLCGLAGSPAQLVGARLLQGLAGALLVPQVLAVITATFAGRARSRAIGWYGTAAGLGSIAGQVLGGLLLDADLFGLGWRVIFLVNVPVGIVAAVLAWRLLPRIAPARRSRLDPLGAAGLAVALALLLVPLTLGQREGWPAWTWLCMAAAAPVGGATLAWQRALRGRGGQPVLDLTLFRVPSYVAGIAAAMAFMLYFASFMFTLTLLLQGGLGLSAFGAGLAFAPMGVLFSTTALVGFTLAARHGLRVVVAGGAITATGLLLLTLYPRLPWVVVALALVGTGNGLVLPQLTGVALVGVRPHQAGIGAAVFTTAQQFAGSAGVAVIGAVFFAVGGRLAATADYTRAMRASALIDLALVLAMLALTTRLRHAGTRR
ncbi:MAG: MFS transporter [Mycobacteriales bacterium]